jgi:hypothetical protein
MVTMKSAHKKHSLDLNVDALVTSPSLHPKHERGKQMANYNLKATKGQTFHEDSLGELLAEASVFVDDLGDNYTVTNINLGYDEDFEPYLTVYYE